ncbi:hypothetical protein GCM10027040_27450 [Halomonas shantousis]
MSMKPIEPGCLALILRGNLANHVVRCVEKASKGEGVPFHPEKTLASEKKLHLKHDFWLVEMTSDSLCDYWVAENNLMRIDGGDELVEQEQHEEQPA